MHPYNQGNYLRLFTQHHGEIYAEDYWIEAPEIPILIELDPYIPIAVRTFSRPIGAVFYRVGNFKTSLVEVPIDPATGTIRGIKLISLDRVGGAFFDAAVPTREGLPIVALEDVPETRRDDNREVSVKLDESRFLIGWSNGRTADTRIRQGRLTFFIGENLLLGAVIEGMDESEKQKLGEHLAKIRNGFQR